MTDTAVIADAEKQKIDDAVATLLAEHPPAECSAIEFRGFQYDAGLAFVHYPEGFGGMGVRPTLQRDVEVAVRSAGASAQSPAQFFMYLAGPSIVTHGTDEQKRRFLRPMFTGEDLWCQLFSEPGAGSDFAGLGCKAERDGDEWVINGQKVWNTLAHVGNWGMLVTRSNPELPKHKGMTYFAVDMHSEGVDVQPLRQITGEAEFNEVFLTDCRIPDANRIGDVGDGWRVALTTLMNERTAIGGGSTPQAGSGPIAEAIKAYKAVPEGRRSTANLDRLMDLYCQSETLRLTNMRAGQNRTAGNPGPEGSIGKMISAELNQDIYEFVITLEGMAGQVDYDYTFRRPEELSVDGSAYGPHHSFLRVRANSIEGGTSEVMRNIIGEQVLGLPGEPRVDKTIPWSDVPKG